MQSEQKLGMAFAKVFNEPELRLTLRRRFSFLKTSRFNELIYACSIVGFNMFKRGVEYGRANPAEPIKTKIELVDDRQNQINKS